MTSCQDEQSSQGQNHHRHRRNSDNPEPMFWTVAPHRCRPRRCRFTSPTAAGTAAAAAAASSGPSSTEIDSRPSSSTTPASISSPTPAPAVKSSQPSSTTCGGNQPARSCPVRSELSRSSLPGDGRISLYRWLTLPLRTSASCQPHVRHEHCKVASVWPRSEIDRAVSAKAVGRVQRSLRRTATSRGGRLSARCDQSNLIGPCQSFRRESHTLRRRSMVQSGWP